MVDEPREGESLSRLHWRTTTLDTEKQTHTHTHTHMHSIVLAWWQLHFRTA